MDNKKVARELVTLAKELTAGRVKVTPSLVLSILNKYDMHSVKLLNIFFKDGLVKEKTNPIEIHVGRTILEPIGPAKKRGLYNFQWAVKK